MWNSYFLLLYIFTIIVHNMPFKLKIIKEFQKSFKSIKDTLETADKTHDFVEIDHRPHLNKSKQKKKITNKNYNFYQALMLREPLQSRHVVNFYNIIGVNQTAIRVNECQESYFRTLFYLKTVKKIQSKSQVLLLHLCDSPLTIPSLVYVIERFKSFGDMKFYELANKMVEVGSRIKAIENLEIRQDKQENNEFLQNYVESLGNRMYICRISNNKMVISKSFLELLQYDSEEFAIQTLKFKAPIHEFASAEKYFQVMSKYFENLRNLLDLVSDRISLQVFLANSIIRFKDYIYTKRNKKIYCKLKVGMPHPLVSIFQLEEVISRSEEFEPTDFFGSYRKHEIETLSDQKSKLQIATVRPLMKLPKNLLPENSHLIAQSMSKTVIDQKMQEDQ